MDSDAIARHEQRLVDQAKEETKRELDDRHRASKRRMVLGGAVVVFVVAVVAIATAVAVTARGSTDGGGSNGASEATVGADGNANGNTSTNGGVQAQPDLFPGCVQQNVLVGDDLSSAALATVIGGGGGVGGADSTKVDVIAALNWPHVSVEYLEQVIVLPRDEANADNDTQETTTTNTTTTTEIRRHVVHPLEDEALELEIGSVDVADFNGDGLPDVVVSEKEMGTLYLYLQNPRDNKDNTNSPITFTGQVLATELPDMESIRAADMNADGLVDIVVVVEDMGLVLLFENNGVDTASADADDGADDAAAVASPQPPNPTFIRSTISDLPQTPEGLDIVDFNGDGLLDTLVASDDDGSIFLFQQLPDGTYQDSVLLTGLEEAKYVTVADLDGDGLLDLVTATSDDASVSWYRQIPPPLPSSSSPYGNYTFGEKTVIFDGIPEVVVAVTADMNGDGDIDIVATSEELSLTYLFENDGKANFLNHLVFEGIVLFDENDLVLADVNGDGQLDIISNGADGSKATVSYFYLSECFEYQKLLSKRHDIDATRYECYYNQTIF